MKDKLFTSFKIKNHTFSNRIGLAPLTRMSSGEDSIPREDVTKLLISRAKSGVALIYTEAIVTDYESAQGYPGQSRMTSGKQIDAWKKINDEIHGAGSKSIMQMFHCGRMAWPQVNPAHRVIAPSPVAPTQENPLTGKPYPSPDEMTVFDIEHVINGFVETARGAVEAGFDGIEIHGAHGYLLSQFLSNYSNKRRDEYGGSLENRFRIIKEIIKGVNYVTSNDNFVTIRISDWGIADMDVSLMETKDTWQELVTLIDKEEVDALSVSTYKYDTDAYGSGKNFAELTREKTDKPIFFCGGIYDRKTAQDAIESSDMILIGKSLLLNHNWLGDIKEGKELKPFSSDDANIAYTAEPLP